MIRKLVLPLVVLLAAWRLLTPASLAVVEGRSMEPTLHDGQFFVIDRFYYHYRPIARGDVVAFYHHDEVYIKRVVAVGGDVVSLLVYPDLNQSEMISAEAAQRLCRAMRGAIACRVEQRKVPRGFLFVMGDHRTISYDSRDFGPVPAAAVIGRARW